jgi:hypothetical protein
MEIFVKITNNSANAISQDRDFIKAVTPDGTELDRLTWSNSGPTFSRIGGYTSVVPQSVSESGYVAFEVPDSVPIITRYEPGFHINGEKLMIDFK